MGLQRGLDGTEVERKQDARVSYTFIAGGYRAKLKEDVAASLESQVDKMKETGKATQSDIDDFLKGWVENAVRVIPRRKRNRQDRETLELLVTTIAVGGNPMPRVSAEVDDEGFGQLKLDGHSVVVRWRRDVREIITWLTNKFKVRTQKPTFAAKLTKWQKTLDGAGGDEVAAAREEVRGLRRDWLEHGMKLLPKLAEEGEFKRHANALEKAVFEEQKVRTRVERPKAPKVRKKGKQGKLQADGGTDDREAIKARCRAAAEAVL